MRNFSLRTVLPDTWVDAVNPIAEGATIEDLKKQAGLDWEIKTSSVMYQPQGTDIIATMPKKKLLYRSDNKKPLSVVSDRYKVVQPGEVLEFYRDLTEAGGFQLETAGVMQGGKKFWAMAKTDLEMRVKGQDLISGYLLLVTGCDGTLATSAFFTSVRAACLNMLHVMIANADEIRPKIRIPHSRQFDANEVKSQLGIMNGSWSTFEEEVVALSDRNVSHKEAMEYFLKVLYPKSDKEGIDLDRAGTKLKLVMDVYESAPGQELKSAHHTAWGLVNAVTRYVDHDSRARSNDSRIHKAWLGAGSTQKQLAFLEAMKLVA